jgi:hypothetical protein
MFVIKSIQVRESMNKADGNKNELPFAPFILSAFHASTLLASVYAENAKRDGLK